MTPTADPMQIAQAIVRKHRDILAYPLARLSKGALVYDIARALALAEAQARVATQADLAWLDEFVVEPEWFPNEGDRQDWHERRQALRLRQRDT